MRASKGNLGKSYYGFCIRDYQGNILYAEANYIGMATNMTTKAMTVKEGLKYYVSQGFESVEIEINSLSLRNFLIKLWRIP